MKDINRLYRILSTEQLKVLEDVFLKTEETLESFKLMKKDYARVKSRIKAIEKKLPAVMEQEGERAFTSHWIIREVGSIENKYKDIDFAIRHYNEYMRQFRSTINSPHFIIFNPQHVSSSHSPFFNDYPVGHLLGNLSSANSRIDDALNAIRITQRYFKNIAGAFKSHANLMSAKKQMEQRLWAQEMNTLPAPVKKQDET